ncbi:hypothetical protein [Natrinema versiforme]|nr:hypothetical protein [Natrinema versiforme]
MADSGHPLEESNLQTLCTYCTKQRRPTRTVR